MSKRVPRLGDMVFLNDGPGFTYVEELQGALAGGECFEIIDPHGEAYIVARARERDIELRGAVHDDGERVAWVAGHMMQINGIWGLEPFERKQS